MKTLYGQVLKNHEEVLSTQGQLLRLSPEILERSGRRPKIFSEESPLKDLK